jgi:hypothetical protein
MRAGGAIIAFMTSLGVAGGGAAALNPELVARLTEKVSGATAAAPPVVQVGGAYVKVGTLFVPVVRNGKLRDKLAMRLTLEATSDATAVILEDNLPRIYDACMRELGARPPEMPTDITSVDIEALRKRLLVVAELVVGTGRIQSLLISGLLPVRS